MSLYKDDLLIIVKSWLNLHDFVMICLVIKNQFTKLIEIVLTLNDFDLKKL